MVLRDRVLHGRGKLLLHLLKGPRRVQKERAAFLDAFRNRVAGDVGRVVARRKVRLVDEIRALDRRLAEAQVGYREAAGLLGVVGEVALRVHIGVVADDLDAVLVRADRSVGTEAEELARDRTLGRRVDKLAERERSAGHIVVDADREVILRLFGIEIVVNGLNHRRREFLAAEAVSAADNRNILAGLSESGHDVLIQRFAEGAGLLRAVEHRNALACRGQRFDKLLARPRTIQTNLDKAELIALAVQVVDRFLHDVRAAAHADEHVLRIRSADVIEQMIASSCDLADFVHVMLNDFRDRVIVLVRRFTRLEVDIRVLRGTADMRMVRVHRAGTEPGDRVPIEQLVHVDQFDLLDFVRGTETVEEMAERNAGLDRGKMRDKSEIHDLLNGSRC